MPQKHKGTKLHQILKFLCKFLGGILCIGVMVANERIIKPIVNIN